MFVNTLDPVLFSLGPIAIRWYGLVYVLGFLGVYIALTKTKLLTEQQADSFLLWEIIGMLLGSRLFHFVFYAAGPKHIIDFFAVWNGGMSFHGALLGIVLAGYLWCRKNAVAWERIADLVVVVAAFFLVLGRIANFVNSEIVGTLSKASWCVEFPKANPPYNVGCRHPVQLYAAVKDVFLGSALFVLYKRNKTPGFVFYSFLLLYGVLRFTVNFFRDDPVILSWLKWGHVLSLALVAIGGYMLATQYRSDVQKLLKPKGKK